MGKRPAAKALSCGRYVATTRSCSTTSNGGHPKEQSHALRCSSQPKELNSRGHRKACFGHSSIKLSRNQHLLCKSSTPISARLPMTTASFHGHWPNFCTAFKSTLELASATRRFCFFVDGLDEYNVIATTSAYPPEYYLETDNEQGRKIRSGHRRIAQLLFDAANNGFVKICVSSRPSNDIRSVFSQCPTFQLELLTKRDMEVFVRCQVRITYAT